MAAAAQRWLRRRWRRGDGGERARRVAGPVWDSRRRCGAAEAANEQVVGEAGSGQRGCKVARPAVVFVLSKRGHEVLRVAQVILEPLTKVQFHQLRRRCRVRVSAKLKGVDL